jgi:prolyl 4-hydroxylase
VAGSTVVDDTDGVARPRAGSALFFSNVDEQGRIDPATLHGGVP